MKLTRISLLIFFALLLPGHSFAFDCGTQTEIPATECEALNALYTSTNGDSWIDNTGWNGTAPCSAYGITCNSGHVEQLYFYSNQLSGSIPAEIGNLTNLTNLYLGVNQLSGSIPVEIGNLTNLIYLYLSYNQLSGSIPTVIFNLTNLASLSLGTNQLTGSIPAEIGNLTNLTYLYLDYNQLSDSIPAEIGNLTNLTHLYLDANMLSGNVPAEIGNLTNLTSLWLGGNLLSGSIPTEIGNLTNLTSLYLDANQLSGAVPISVAQVGASASSCDFTYNTLCIPDTAEYQAIGQDPICGLSLSADCEGVSSSDPSVIVTSPNAAGVYNHGDQVTITWTTENAQPTDNMVISMKRDSVHLPAPDDENYYRFSGDPSNDGTETVTIPDTVLNADDWRFEVRHSASDASGVSSVVSIEEASDKTSLWFFKTGDGSGSVSSVPAGITCGSACDDQLVRFPVGETVVLTADANGCSTFTGWKGCDQVNGNECTVTLDRATRSISAEFIQDVDSARGLDVFFMKKSFEQGRIISNPPGIDCSDNDTGKCRAAFCIDDMVSLTAYPAEGSTFKQMWDYYGNYDAGLCTSVSGNTCIVDLSKVEGWHDIEAYPEFFANGPYRLNVSVDGYGTVRSEPAGINCSSDDISPSNCGKKFNLKEAVTLTAEPNSYMVFSHWAGWMGSDCFQSKDPVCTFIMKYPHTIEAVFKGKDMGISIRSDEDMLTVDYKESVATVEYIIEVTNKNTFPSSPATVTIDYQSPVGSSGREAYWRCLDATEGTCEKKAPNSFSVTLDAHGTILLEGIRRYGLDINTATVRVSVDYSGDLNEKNNASELVLHRDPADLGIDTAVMLKYHTGNSETASERNTLVLTHGWQYTDPGECSGKKGDDRLNCLGEHLWTGGNTSEGQAAALVAKNLSRLNSTPVRPNLITDRINIIQYIWNGAFSKTGMRADGYIKARRAVFNAGQQLGQRLLKDLGSSYDGKIHLVGHSLGTAVNAYATRYLLDNMSYATIQMTVLDQPNRVDRIGIFNRLNSAGETQWGFDKNFFANVLPELNDPDNVRLFVDNYFAAGTFDDSGIATAGVGTKITGLNVYNHLVSHPTTPGLQDPNDVGGVFFGDEGTFGLFDNDHTGVHQWYRWTIWPSSGMHLFDNVFKCQDHMQLPDWYKVSDGRKFNYTLNPCRSGFAFSILQNSPLHWTRNGKKSYLSSSAAYDLIGGEASGCLVHEIDLLYVTCGTGITPKSATGKLSTKEMMKSATISTSSSYTLLDINLAEPVANLSLNYKFENSLPDEDVFLLIDGSIVWSMNAASVPWGSWLGSGKIPVFLKKGTHKIMLAFNKTTDTSSFTLNDLEFFKDPDADTFPWPMFLPAITGHNRP